MRRIFAVICTLLTLYAIKETIFICLAKDPDIVAQRAILVTAALSITIPLLILSLWLWKPRPKIENQ